jgi:hypothetical protein
VTIPAGKNSIVEGRLELHPVLPDATVYAVRAFGDAPVMPLIIAILEFTYHAEKRDEP